jgi:hypothetical protein
LFGTAREQGYFQNSCAAMNGDFVPLILQLGQCAPELLKKLLNAAWNAKLPALLRATSRQLRDAVNRTVWVVELSLKKAHDVQQDAFDITSELATTFTNARSLVLDVSDASATAEVTFFLRRLQDKTALLLGNLQSLTVTMNAEQATALGSASLLQFLRR